MLACLAALSSYGTIALFTLRFVLEIPSTWGFILTCMLLRIAEGVGTALFFTGTFSTFPKLFPNSVSLLMVRSDG